MNPDKHKQIYSFKEKRLISLVQESEMITPENFFINTQGTFEPIQSIPDNFKMIAQTKGSQYFVNEEQTNLIRISDHWGHGIKFCKWNLQGHPKKHCRKFKKENGGMFMGIIAFANLKPYYHFKIEPDRHNAAQEIVRPPDPNTKSITRQKREISREKNHSLTLEILKLELPKPTPDDFKVNHVAELWNEIVTNKFQNLSFDKFKERFDKYAAVKIKILVPKYQCRWAQSCDFRLTPDHV